MADAEQSDAARRAAARKAKILARGNTGLAKLAQTARGEEADKLYGQDCEFIVREARWCRRRHSSWIRLFHLPCSC